MRTTLNLDEKILQKASQMTGIRQKTALIHAGLDALIAKASAQHLAALGGSQPDLRPAPRRRPRMSR